MARGFSHDEVFPIVARLISDLYGTKNDFVTHDELVDALLKDAVGIRLIERACEADGGAKSKGWWASNMVQWFSQRITEEKSDYRMQFERKSIGGAWAYRPVD
jgi:hypothetical protein